MEIGFEFLFNISFEKKKLFNILYVEIGFDFVCNISFEKELFNILYVEIGFDFFFVIYPSKTSI